MMLISLFYNLTFTFVEFGKFYNKHIQNMEKTQVITTPTNSHNIIYTKYFILAHLLAQSLVYRRNVKAASGL